MAKTIAQLRREIASQRKRLAKETDVSEAIAERQKLSRELFKLKNQKLIGAGAKAKRLSKRFGKGLLKVGQKAAPVIKKQARLIRDQQLRDDAIARARSKKVKTPSVSKTKSSIKFKPIKGKKGLFKKIKIKKTKITRKKKSKPKQQSSSDIFGNLDF